MTDTEILGREIPGREPTNEEKVLAAINGRPDGCFMAGLDGSIPGLGPAALKAVELEIEADIEATTEASRR